MTTRPIPRYTTSMTLAALITGGLLLMMQTMIATGRDPVVDSVRRLLPVLVPTRADSTVRERQKPEPPLLPTDRPTLPPTVIEPNGTVRIELPPPAGPAGRTTIKVAGEMNGAPIALVKVAAVYPPRAIGRGLEGYAIVEYTVTRTGAVADVRVVESSDVIFEHSAIVAAEKFRYRPRIVGGEAVATPGVLNKFTFSLED